jgi:hypothetical protein
MAFATFSLLSAGLFAQTNFTGTWVFNQSKSNVGDGPMFSPTTITVTQTADLISLESVQPSFEGGDMKMSDKYNLNGKESVNTGMMNSSIKTITTWSDDKKELKFAKTIIFDMNGEKMEIKSTEIWSLAADGKSLTVKNSSTSQMGDSNLTLVYDKK